MRRLLILALPALLAMMLAACETYYSSGVPEVALEAPQRCAHCGWIESRREIPPGAADSDTAPVYEYTVRMRDGSSGIFREKLPSAWQEGQRLIFIKGAAD